MKGGWSLDKRDKHFIQSLLPSWDWLYHHYFFVKSSGWQHIPQGKVLLVGSHNGGLSCPDMLMFMHDWYRRFGVDRAMYGLMHPKIWEYSPWVAAFMEKIGAIAAHPTPGSNALAQNQAVLVYPGGGEDAFRPFHQWDKICLQERKGFIKLAIKERAPIVPVVSVGAHHTLYVLGDLHPILNELHKHGMPWLFNEDPKTVPVYLGLPWGLTIGAVPNIPIPTPIHIRVCEPLYLEPAGGKSPQAAKEYVDHCYDRVVDYMQNELDKLIAESPYKKQQEAAKPSIYLEPAE